MITLVLKKQSWNKSVENSTFAGVPETRCRVHSQHKNHKNHGWIQG